MLESIRKHSSSIVVKVFLGVLAVTFVFCFGISDIIRRYMGKDYLIKIGNVKITLPLFNLEKAKKLNMLRAHSKQIDEKEESAKILHQVIWENVVDLAASEFGFIVSDETIKKYISGMYMFRDEQGRFNSAMLRGFLSKIQVSEPMFIEFSRKDIKNALIKAPFKYVSVYNELDYYIKSHLEKRTLMLVKINPDSITISEKPTEKELEEFYQENMDSFMISETRTFKVLEFFESVCKIKISEDEIKDFYETSADKEYKTYEEMKSEIESELMQEKIQNEMNEKSRQIEDALMAGENIEEIAKKFNLKIHTMTNVSALNKSDKSDVKSTTYKDDILTVAFSTEEGFDSSFSEAVDEKGNKLLWLVHVDSITPKHVAEFSKITGKVKNEWIKRRQKSKAIELAQVFVDQVNSGEKLSSISSKNGRIAIITPAFDRDGKLQAKKNENNIEDMIAILHQDAFLSKDAFSKQIEDNVVVAQVNEIIPADDVDQKERNTHHAALIRDMSEDLYQQLVGYLSKEKYEVKINHEMLKESGEGIDQTQIDDMF
jgi:hypothetical protein